MVDEQLIHLYVNDTIKTKRKKRGKKTRFTNSWIVCDRIFIWCSVRFVNVFDIADDMVIMSVN